MSHMTKVIQIDAANNTFTAQAGLQIIDASKALRQYNLQFITNIEIGNMTLGAAACCHSKDALDGIEFGQVSSYVIEIKWVTPAGEPAGSLRIGVEPRPAASGAIGVRSLRHRLRGHLSHKSRLRRSGIFTYTPRTVDDLTEAEVDNWLDTSEGLNSWTVGRTCAFFSGANASTTREYSVLWWRPPAATYGTFWRRSCRSLYRPVSFE